MMTPEQLDNWFTYHAPTAETALKYKAVRAAEINTARVMDDAIDNDDCDKLIRFERINNASRAFAQSIDENAPDSADKTAAIRCVRLARNAANEAVIATADHADHLRAMCATNLTAARFQANSAIACGGK